MGTSPPPQRDVSAIVLRRLAYALGASGVLAFLLAWADTGAIGGEGWLDAFLPLFAQIGFIGAVIAAQAIGLLTGIITGVVLAFLAVVVFEGEMASVHWVGKFFLLSLKMIIVPLIVFALLSGITALGDVRKLGRLGGRTVGYYALTTLMAVVIGTILVNIIQPGQGIDVTGTTIPDRVAGKESMGMVDIVMSFVTDNIFWAMGSQRPQMLPIIIFTLMFGAVLTTLGAKGRAVIDVAHGCNEAMMKMVHLIMVLAPVGVFGLVAGRFGEELHANGTEAFLAQLSALAWYAVAVVGGLAIHAFVVIPILLATLTKHSPHRYAKGMGSALLTAFSTASSAATMPLTLECVEENNGVDERASQFVIPLGATVNMDGTALYEAVAAIFIAQAYGIELGFGEQIMVVITATLAAVGAAGIPEAGLVTLVMVLQAVGLPLEGVGLILAIDWLLDRFRTTVNVWGDAVGAAVMERHGLSWEPGAEPGDPAAEDVA